MKKSCLGRRGRDCVALQAFEILLGHKRRSLAWSFLKETASHDKKIP
jgi:hypothetical protein